MMAEMLRPCPYCGGKAECERRDRCIEMYSRNREEAILSAYRKWNRRVT